MKMAFLEMRYYSEALHRRIAFNVLLPEMPKKDKGAGLPNVESYKTLYLFHGLSGDCSDWIRKSGIELYAEKYGIYRIIRGFLIINCSIGYSHGQGAFLTKKHFLFRLSDRTKCAPP